jgi:hypothetical protein
MVGSRKLKPKLQNITSSSIFDDGNLVWTFGSGKSYLVFWYGLLEWSFVFDLFWPTGLCHVDTADIVPDLTGSLLAFANNILIYISYIIYILYMTEIHLPNSKQLTTV